MKKKTEKIKQYLLLHYIERAPNWIKAIFIVIEFTDSVSLLSRHADLYVLSLCSRSFLQFFQFASRKRISVFIVRFHFRWIAQSYGFTSRQKLFAHFLSDDLVAFIGTVTHLRFVSLPTSYHTMFALIRENARQLKNAARVNSSVRHVRFSV